MTTAAHAVVRTSAASRIGAVAGLALLALLAAAPYWASPGDMRTLVEALTLLALAQMWNLLAGYAGLVSIGQQAYIGIGAYALYVLADKAGVHPFLAVPLAGVIALVLAVPTATLAFRLRGGYFAIGTWVIAEVYRLLVVNTESLGGGTGVTVTSAARLDRELRIDGTYWLALAVGVGSILLAYLVLRSRLGLALTAIRDNEAGAASLGVDVLRTKVLAYLVASFGCGVAGAVVYLNLLRIQPDAAFSVSWTAYVIFIVVIGGIGTLEGPILGTIIFFVMRESLSDYGVWYLVALGVVAVGVMVWVPGGIWNLVVRRFGLRFFPVQRRLRLDQRD